MSQSLRESLLLLPCSGLDDFPESISSSDSSQLLSGWLALWHPSMIAQSHVAPRWHAADQPPHDFSGVFAVVPDISQEKLPSDLAGTAQRGGGWLCPADSDWRSLQSRWLAQWESAPQLPAADQSHWQTEFAALGYAYLQVQFLTRQLRYTSNLDQILFDSQLDHAAQAALSGENDEAEKMVQSCFDQLGQERDHYYSLDVSLIDVTLLASTTLGAGMTAQLARPHATTFIANADLLRTLRSRSPQLADELKEALRTGRASLAGGLDIERPHPLMSFDTLRRDLERGRAAYEELGYQRPKVFTRFTYGQMSDMPLHLRRSGFVASMLVAWQDGVYPSGSHAKFSWEASEGTFINAVAPPLADAQDASTYLTYGRRIAEALDHQHVPVFMLAHWPDKYSPYFELLQRVVARTPALGKWQHADDFFEKTDQPYHQEHLPPRKFVFDYLSPNPSRDASATIACSVAYHRLSGRVRMLQNVLNLSYQLENFRAPAAPARSSAAVNSPAALTSPLGSPENRTADAEFPASTMDSAMTSPAAATSADATTSAGSPTSTAATTSADAPTSASPLTSSGAALHAEENEVRGLTLAQLSSELKRVADRVDALFDAASSSTGLAQLEAELDTAANRICERFARAAGHKPTAVKDGERSFDKDSARSLDRGSARSLDAVPASHATTDAAALLVINSTSAPQRVTVRTNAGTAPLPGGAWLYASGAVGDQRWSMVDVPGYGMLTVPLGPVSDASARREKTLVQGEGSLLNDFLEIQVDPRSGNLRSLHVPGKRGNRLSVQLVRREKPTGGPAEFSSMQVGSLRTLQNTAVLGIIRVEGQMMFRGQQCGDFEIDYQLARGSRVLTITGRLSQLQPTHGSLWNNAYVLRTAWPNESAVLTLRCCGSRQSWPAGRVIAPAFIEIDEADYRTYLLPAGLAFHQRVEQRFLETILSSGATGECEFQLGIGVDLPNPAIAANEFQCPPAIVPLQANVAAGKPVSKSSSAVSSAAAWLMHVDAKHVVMELEAPLVDADGRCVGMRVHVSETANKSVTLRIRALREVAEAHRVDYLGGRIAKLTVEGDTTSIALRPSEMTFIDLIWK